MAYEMNSNPDRELDWDEEISNESNGFVLLPEGDYPFTITKMERVRFNGSAKVPPCRMAKLTVALHGGDNGESSVICQIFLLQKFQWKISELFVSIGLARPEDERILMQWGKVEGATGRCHVGVREYTKQSGPHAGETGQSNEITKFLPPKIDDTPVPSWQQGAF